MSEPVSQPEGSAEGSAGKSAEHRFRKLTSNLLAVLLSVFVLTAVNTNLFDEQPNLALFGMLGLMLVFLSRPAVERWEAKPPLRALDWALVIATMITFGYVFVQSE